MRKHKARFFARGENHIEVVNYFEIYAPIAAWSTVRMVMNIAIQRKWSTRQVDFSNAFVQEKLKEEIFLELPGMFSEENHNSTDEGVVLKLNKSLYGLVQAPRSWYHHLQCGLTKLDFVPLAEDPRIYYGRGMILITYVDNTLLFGPDLNQIEKVVSKLEGLGYGLTLEEGDESTAFAFLGVSITPYPVTKMLRLTQTGIIEKILKSTGMSDCNTQGSPANYRSLGTDATGAHQKYSWNSASVIGIMMSLA